MEDAMPSEDADPLSGPSQNLELDLREQENKSPSITTLKPESPPILRQTQESAVSALQCKDLRENNIVWKEPGSKNQVVPGTFMLGYALTDAWCSSSSDEDGDNSPMFLTRDSKPELQYNPNASDELLAIPRSLGEGASLENLSSNTTGIPDNSSASDKPWIAPKYFWKAIKADALGPKMDVAIRKDRLNGGTLPWVGSTKLRHKFPRELQRSDSLESHLRKSSDTEVDPCELWRADSLDSMCSSSMSLAERVEMNRGLLRQILQKTSSKSYVHRPKVQEPTINDKGIGVIDSDWDSGISLQGSEHSQRAFVLGEELPLSPRHEQAKRLLERARMKARSNPLKADHTILPIQRDNPELLSWVGVPLQQAPLGGKDGVVSGNLSDSSSSESAGGTRRRHGQSPTRVRFEDESEKDAEVRYQERLRQRRRAGERAQGLLVSKPSLAAYINRQADPGHGSYDSIFWKTKAKKSLLNGKSPESANKQCNSCGTFLNESQGLNSNTLSLPNGKAEGKSIPCWVAPTLPSRLVRIEQIKETYIGTSPAIVHSDGTHCCPADTSSGRGTFQKLKKKVRKFDSKREPFYANGVNAPPPLNGTQMCLSNGAGLPLNPYASDPFGPKHLTACNPTSSKGLALPVFPANGEQSSSHHLQVTPPSIQPKKSALKSSSKNRSNDQRSVTIIPSSDHHQDSTEAGLAVENHPQEQASSGLGYWEERPGLVTPGSVLKINLRNLPVSEERATDVEELQVSGHLASDVTSIIAESTPSRPSRPGQNLATSPNLSQASPEADHREARPKLSLRRFFSAMGLNSVGLLGKGRSSSMDQLSLHPKPSSNLNQLHRPSSPSVSPSHTHRHHHQLKKAPSLQTIRMQGSPFLQLRRSSSAQNLQIPGRITDRSSAYSPGEQPCSPMLSRDLQRALSVEDVGRPSAVRAVGRVAQAFPDGTVLLELSRPPSGPFGFVISRGRGRPDSGVYVEEMGDNNTEKLYAGLLGVGDEILEVNGEKVAGLSLELVTRLMTQNSTASIRVLRHRRLQR
ncbi:hypothetical protein DNTS_010166 [Danionella cerebrum]|uniref:PDZ domain-containing protein n=1 Tax=Danionella cerebrum TaxID=2873325 RepID=A0A553Q6M3_9TELE|nr:hypothetical protein DNTS_010166 [Danionella translucida]TRY85587.1 hypothetical protein DNTS_010166 [Danionella translucida]TRY85588.1 hypothetical protein DNTS_010166 [Danionella translucida]TRY85589.1 hypothetical protein DNTS_010166 [Danionella translucida]